MDTSFSKMRVEYRRGRLSAADLSPDPFLTFAEWLAEATEAGLHEPNAMTLATVSAEGRPSARVVLLKGVDPAGFTFFTNYASRKGQELAVNPFAALVFWWGELERQVRVEGRVEMLSAEESDAYYHSRPKGSRIGAWVSAQSQVIPNRQVLEQRWQELAAAYAGADPARPPFWGGYRLVPDTLEFWQGGPNRLHDRLRYRRVPDGWQIDRLSP